MATVIATIQTTLTDPTGDLPEPVAMTWATDATDVDVMLSVAQLLKSRDDKYSKVVAIRIEL